MNNLFEKYPVITYNDTVCLNILAKVKMNDTSFNNASIFYPYTIKDGERPDHVALNYYGDARYVWAVYMSNKTIDPYYEWPLDSDSFQSYIISKYGSYENAVDKTSFYRVAYAEDDRMLDGAAYDALTSNLKKYWRPVINDNGSTLFYVRKEQDLAVDTNKIVSIEVADVDGFVVGENIKQYSVSGNLIASGNIKSIQSSSLIIRHVEGAFAASGLTVGSVSGVTSQSSTTVTTATTLATPIPSDEFVYWEPITFYQYEDEINIGRKFIKLLDAAYIDKAEKEIQDLL